MFQFEFHGALFQLDAREPQIEPLLRLPLNPLPTPFALT
jgi:hypothetical protein